MMSFLGLANKGEQKGTEGLGDAGVCEQKDAAAATTVPETGNQADDSLELADEKAGDTGHGPTTYESESCLKSEDTEAKASSGGTDSVAVPQVESKCIPSVMALFSASQGQMDGDADEKGETAKQADDKTSVASGHWSNWKGISERLDTSKQDKKLDKDKGGPAWEWEWDHFVSMRESTLRVELCGSQVRDRDLPSLFRHLEQLIQSQTERNSKGKMNHDIDLSCNDFITDVGVTNHLAPFLERYPACARLKLYKTAIGDKALESLGAWIARGYAHELHLSDLRGHVSGEAVYGLLKQVHEGGNYPYRHSDKVTCPLWLRLEYNGIKNPEKIVARGKAAEMSLCVVEKNDLQRCRPGTNETKKGLKKVPAVHLVLFAAQTIRQPKFKKGSNAVEEEATEQWPEPKAKATSKKYDSWDTDDAAWQADDMHWEAADSRWDESSWNTVESSWMADQSSWNTDTGKYDKRSRTGSEASGKGRGKVSPSNVSWPASQSGVAYEQMLQHFGQGVQPTKPADPAIRAAQLSTACDLLDAIDPRVREGDAEVFQRWRDSVERAAEPQSEASRIAKMVGKLCAQGYNSTGSYGGAVTPKSTPTATPTIQHLAPRAVAGFSLPPEVLAPSDSLGVTQPAAGGTGGTALLSGTSPASASSSFAAPCELPGEAVLPGGDVAAAAAAKKKKGKNKISSVSAADISEDKTIVGDARNADGPGGGAAGQRSTEDSAAVAVPELTTLDASAIVSEPAISLPVQASNTVESTGGGEVCAADVKSGGDGTGATSEGTEDKLATPPGDSGPVADTIAVEGSTDAVAHTTDD